MWKIPPLVGQVVRLNPEGQHYDTYNRRQAKGDFGIITTNFQTTPSDLAALTVRQRRVHVKVQWANGHYNDYDSTELLPVENYFADILVVDGMIYTTRDRQIELETYIMQYGTKPTMIGTDARKRLLVKVSNRIGDAYRDTSSQNISLSTWEKYIQDAIDAEENVISLEHFYAKANGNYVDNEEAKQLVITLTNASEKVEEEVASEAQVFESTTHAEASMPEPPPNVRRVTETYDEYLSRIARDGVEINGFDIEYAMSLGEGTPDNGSPPPPPPAQPYVRRRTVRARSQALDTSESVQQQAAEDVQRFLGAVRAEARPTEGTTYTSGLVQAMDRYASESGFEPLEPVVRPEIPWDELLSSEDDVDD